MTENTDLAAAMACDEDLLADLGRVAWAAAHLHAAVRDAVTAIPAAGTGPGFSERTLSLALAELEHRSRQLSPAARKQVLSWSHTVGRPAKNGRDQVLHAVTATTPDGSPALMATDPSGPGPFTVADLQEVTGQLLHATLTLPRPPYITPQVQADEPVEPSSV